MRKKLLALLMCATMVLGTAVTASAYSADDVTNAKKVVDQFDYFKAEFNAGKFNETTDVTVKFTTNYVSGANQIMYTYGLSTDDTNGNFVTPVKLDKDGKDPLVKVADSKAAATAIEKEGQIDSVRVSGVKQLNVSVTTGDIVKVTEAYDAHYYYVASVKKATAGYTLAADEVVVRSTVTTSPIAVNENIAVLKEYDPKVKTGTVDIGKMDNFQDGYGVDVDGYIPLKATTALVKAYTTLSDNYYVIVKKSEKVADIAEALANKTITKDAVAVDMQFYKLDTATVPNKTFATPTGAIEYGFKSLFHCNASRMGVDVKVATDWLSRTNLKSASGVTAYILDENIPNVTNYFQRLGSVYKVADVVDGKFTADYLISGTYIFDVAAATENAGQADADATKPAADNTASPKTGDVAPIAALAVVMMGAFGAMVVASKKRA